MKIVTTSEISGFEITETIGLVRGNTIRVRNIGRDILALLRMLIGGEVNEYTKMMGEAREQALDRMTIEAQSMGADAIVNVQFTTSFIMSGAAEILAYGTAVRLRRK
ncbi:MAG: YbjQ family protein [Candidatus Cyclonatronum sp.]|uniref:YbjQ family protein n=1 Tax=Cyclonatronum sp. TaxID=3024185 RepID=UPI0025C57929|nr:YbjQ family protein [Cyclonatronum sp.]MCH8486437.1 YbjQ family protein [Cyclonatronum sp.]